MTFYSSIFINFCYGIYNVNLNKQIKNWNYQQTFISLAGVQLNCMFYPINSGTSKMSIFR